MMKGQIVAVKVGRLQKCGEIVDIQGQNVYVAYKTKGNNTEIGKFHIDTVIEVPVFQNDAQANNWKKQHGFRKTLNIPASRIALRYSKGNMKLQSTKDVEFRQWNIPAVDTCPLRTPMCESSCYALKAERIYPTVKARRAESFKVAIEAWFVEAMIEQIESDIASTKRTIKFRIHESGDFFSRDYFKAWCEIVNHFKGSDKISFYVYTKSVGMVKSVLKDRAGYEDVNMTILFSLWDDTKPHQLAIARELGLKVFTAVEKGTAEREGYIACPSSEVFADTDKEKHCGECGLCSLKFGQDIAIEIH